MKIVVGNSRGSGKTTKLVDLVKKNSGILLTFSTVEADRIAREFSLNKNTVMSWEYYLQHNLHLSPYNKKRPIYIDNLDHFIYENLGGCIDGFSIDGEIIKAGSTPAVVKI